MCVDRFTAAPDAGVQLTALKAIESSDQESKFVEDGHWAIIMPAGSTTDYKRRALTARRPGCAPRSWWSGRFPRPAKPRRSPNRQPLRNRRAAARRSADLGRASQVAWVGAASAATAGDVEPSDDRAHEPQERHVHAALFIGRDRRGATGRDRGDWHEYCFRVCRFPRTVIATIPPLRPGGPFVERYPPTSIPWSWKRPRNGMPRSPSRRARSLIAPRPASPDHENELSEERDHEHNPILLDEHRGMVPNRRPRFTAASPRSRRINSVAIRRTELEKFLLAAPASTWPRRPAQGALSDRAPCPASIARDPRRQKLIAGVLEDFVRLSGEPAGQPGATQPEAGSDTTHSMFGPNRPVASSPSPPVSARHH